MKKKPIIILIEGPMGSGKTTIGTLVQSQMKRTVLLSTDRVKRFISDFKRGQRDNSIAAKIIYVMADQYLKLGISLVVAQAFWRREYMEPYKKLAKKHQAKIYIYQLEAPRAVLLERIAKRPLPEGAKYMPKSRTLRNLRVWKQNRYNAGRLFDTSRISAQKVAHEILKEVKR